MRRVGIQERRARLGLRHHLAPSARGASAVDAARGVVALHATDPASVILSAIARMRDGDVAAVERALYVDRTLVRLLGMRRTVFVVPVELVGVVMAASTRAILPIEQRKAVQFVEEGGLTDDGESWLRAVGEATLAALRARGEATGAELSAEVAPLRERVIVAAGTRNETEQRMTTRVLFLLAAQGRIVRGRPLGSWTSSQYRWAPVESWLPDGVPDLPTRHARAQLVQGWLAAFGPGTQHDVTWWTGWGKRDTAQALADVGAVQVDLDGEPGVLLPDDLDEVATPEPWVALLPALDPTPMGWAGRDFHIGEHRGVLFDRTGNIGPTVWCDGRIVGGWAQRPDGEVVVRVLEDVGAEPAAHIAATAADLTTAMGGVRVTPRFRTPLERELSS